MQQPRLLVLFDCSILIRCPKLGKEYCLLKLLVLFAVQPYGGGPS